MTNSVLYLCYANQPEKIGLVFPQELLENTYSPGLWVVLKSGRDFSESYNFDAVDEGKVVNLRLRKVEGNVFFVDTKYGKLYFRLVSIFFRYQRYVGNSSNINTDTKLYHLVSLDIQRLERICLQNRFYFVGSIDNNISNSQ